MPEKPKFILEKWYNSESAKRQFGRICQTVNEHGETVHLLGTEKTPFLCLTDVDLEERLNSDVVLSIDEVRADWSSVIQAALLGTRFWIKGRKIDRAVLYRLHGVKHPSEKYLRSSSLSNNIIAQKLEDLAGEVRKLSKNMVQTLSVPYSRDFFREVKNLRHCVDALEKYQEKLDRSSGLIDRRFRELWRDSNNYSIQQPMV